MFDALAPEYDASFSHTPLGRSLRAIVWERLAELFPAGAHVLELGCGTGEDARHLGSRGVRVLATDQSEAMLALSRRKTAGLPVECARLDLERLPAVMPLPTPDAFDGAFSNFGTLNLLADHRALAGFLAAQVRPGGAMLLVVMGRWCAWEILWHLLRLDVRNAFRRLRRDGAHADLAGAAVRVYYPSPRALRQAFAPHFRLRRARPLGLFLPPSYLEPLTRRSWFPLRACRWLDRRAPWPLWGDHVIYEFARTPH